MTAHDLHDRDGPGVIYACVNADLPHCGCHISGSAAKTRRMVCEDKVIVNGLRFPQHYNTAAHLSPVPRQLAHGIHGIISADIEEISDAHVLKLFKQCPVHRVLQILRQLISAGTKIGSGGGQKPFQLIAGKRLVKIQDFSL